MTNDTHFDAIIVGTGFGGSVTAYRLAEAGLRVCVLERGKAYPPGSFPRSPHGLKRNFWDPSEGLHGLFNFWSFRRIEALVASGLGGGSLIYANVLLRKDEKWFVKEDLSSGGYEHWPMTRDDLEPHYDRVEKMLRLERYPFDHDPYSETSKTKAMRDAAERLNLPWQLPPLAVTFTGNGGKPVPGAPIHEDQPNYHGLPRQTCSLCGECDIGCNFGSKNTLDFNYLTEAQRLGAEIRTLSEVRRFGTREGGGYDVHYVTHDPERDGKKTETSRLPEQHISADRLLLAAGSLGTTFLLLRNKSAFPHISDKLGTRFSGNGDLLGFTTGGRYKMDPSYGPVITAAIRGSDSLDGGEGRGRGFYVEDAGYPQFINWMLEMAETSRILPSFLHFAKRRLRETITGDREGDLSAEISQMLGESKLSSTALPLLGMGRDVPGGQMTLRKGRLDISWKPDQSSEYFERLRATMKSMAEVWGANFTDNPVWYLKRLMTTHPIGGCPMGRNENEGVVDANGEVFNYPSMYIVDGSNLPGPVGTNPALTIAACADCFADRMVEN